MRQALHESILEVAREAGDLTALEERMREETQAHKEDVHHLHKQLVRASMQLQSISFKVESLS